MLRMCPLHWTTTVHIPCCDHLTHPMCVDDDIDVSCPSIGNSCPECGDTVDPSSAGHGALRMFSCCPESPYHVQCLSRVAVSEGDSVFCPRCQGGRRDHVDVGWVQRMCHINGVEWPVPPQVTCVLCMDSMGEDRVAVPCCNHVGCLAQSFNACGARCPFCVQPLREFAESPVFQAAALFHGHSVDVSGQPTNRGTNSLVLPSGFPSPPENLLLCCCRVGPPPQFEPSGLQCGNSRRWLGICSGSVSHVLAPFRQVTSRVAHRCPVECSHMVVDLPSSERWN